MFSTSEKKCLDIVDILKILRNLAIYALPVIFTMQNQIIAYVDGNVYLWILLGAAFDIMHRWYKDNTK